MQSEEEEGEMKERRCRVRDALRGVVTVIAVVCSRCSHHLFYVFVSCGSGLSLSHLSVVIRQDDDGPPAARRSRSGGARTDDAEARARGDARDRCHYVLYFNSFVVGWR